jgi:hypothetical protein
VIGEHQDNPKWKGPQELITKCLVNFQTFDFKGGIWDKKNHFPDVQRAQNMLLGNNASKLHLYGMIKKVLAAKMIGNAGRKLHPMYNT